MRIQRIRTGAACIAALVFCSGLWAQVIADCLPEMDPYCSTEVRLLAGQYMEVGSVVVQTDGVDLCVTYMLNEEALLGGWLIYETHLAIGYELADIPQTKGNAWGTNPIPGLFPYGGSLCDGVPCWNVCIPLADLGLLPGDVIYIAAHAVVSTDPAECGEDGETAWGEGSRFNERGNWGMYFLFEVCEEPGPPISYFIGYEDFPANCDYDYNDFGMDFNVAETYDAGILRTIEMEFIARVNYADNEHDIHILRSLQGDYTYTLMRPDHTAFGNEDPEVTDEPGSGVFDVILFDTEAWPDDPSQVMGQTVQIVIEMDADNNSNTAADFGPPPRFDVDMLFSLYNPMMYNRNTSNMISVASMGPAQSPPLPAGTYNVPCMLVLPTSDWAHPDEQVTVTGDRKSVV